MKGKFKILNLKTQICILQVAGFILLALASNAFAVPETASVRITDVTPTSFSVVWMTDVAADPEVEVYSESSMTNQITDKFIVTRMPAGSQKVAVAAKGRGIMKVRVSGLSPSSK
ncbi:MAG: hypothetical protein EPN94_02075, partial [Nitrospirae bacterium]